MGGLANRRVIHVEIIPDSTHHDLTAVEADPKLGMRAGTGHLSYRPLHRQCRVRCPQGVIGLRVWGVEDGHEGVAHELHHRAALREDDRHHHPERGVEHCHDLGRCSAFREGRVSAQVREEDRHFDLLAAKRCAGRVLDQSARHLR